MAEECWCAWSIWIKTSLRFVIRLQVFYVPKSLRGRLPSYLTCISAWDFRFCHRTEVETGKSRPSWLHGNKESQALEYWELWWFWRSVMIDDWSRTNIDTEGPGAVCTRVVIHPPVKYGPTSWDTKALANDGWCFCSNDVTSGELFLVHVWKKWCPCSTI